MSEAVYSTLQRMLSSRNTGMTKAASKEQPTAVGIDAVKLASLCEQMAECLPYLQNDLSRQEQAVANATSRQKIAALYKTASSGQEGELAEIPLGPEGQLPEQIPFSGENEVNDLGYAASGLSPDEVPDTETPDETPFSADNALETNQELPAKIARRLKQKFAEDSLSPANIKCQKGSAALPTTMGMALGTGPSVGPAELKSHEALINATRRDFKRTRPEMAQWLSEPAQSKKTDPVLHDAFEMTDEAGAKIAAARTLLKKWAEANPRNSARLRDAMTRVKTAAPIPGSSAGEVSDEALAAAARGVTPEQIAAAQLQLAAQIVPPGAPQPAMGGMAPPQEMMPPQGGMQPAMAPPPGGMQPMM